MLLSGHKRWKYFSNQISRGMNSAMRKFGCIIQQACTEDLLCATPTWATLLPGIGTMFQKMLDLGFSEVWIQEEALFLPLGSYNVEDIHNSHEFFYIKHHIHKWYVEVLGLHWPVQPITIALNKWEQGAGKTGANKCNPNVSRAPLSFAMTVKLK